MLKIEDEIREVLRLRDDEDLSWEQIGTKLGFSEATARRRHKAGVLAEAANDFIRQTAASEEDEDLPETQSLGLDVKSPYIPNNLPEILRFKPLVRAAEDVMVTCDWHVPLHDASLANAMVNVALENNIKKLIIGGDFFNMESFSHFLPHQPEAEFEREKYEGNYIMKALLQTFEEIDFIWGNHDFRITRFLGYKHSFVECMKWVLSELDDDEMARIRFSDLDHMYLQTADRRFRICHPRNFSTNPLSVGRDLALKHGCSIITAHSHHLAMGFAKDGRSIVIEGGGLYSPEHTEYIQKTSKHHSWVPGFTMFKESVPTLFGPQLGNVQEYVV